MRPFAFALLLLSSCGAGSTGPARGEATSPDSIVGAITRAPPPAWSDAPSPEPSPVDARLDVILTGSVSRLVRRNPMPDGISHDIDYTGHLACVAERTGDELTVRLGPPDGRSWDLLTLHVSGPPEQLQAEASASWHRDTEPFVGVWRELAGELRLSDQYPTTTAALRGEFALHGLLEQRPTRLVGSFVLDADGFCHSNLGGAPRSRHTGDFSTAE